MGARLNHTTGFRRRLRPAIGLCLVTAAAGLVVACGGANAPATFHGDVAPVLREHCVSCHRPGGSAPFSLVTFGDAKRRARTMVEATRRHYMPPWLPSKSGVELEGARGLTDDEIACLERWVAGGMEEGRAPAGHALRKDTAQAPATRKDQPGNEWANGPPDLVITAPDAAIVPARGPDIFRNLVIPTGLAATRFVRTIEIRPGDPRVVHHGILAVDGSGDAIRRDAAAPGPGFPGMDIGRAVAPDGYFLGWTPGKRPTVAPDDMAWRIRLGEVFVLQLHLVPSGREQTIRPKIGLYFTDTAPKRSPFSVVLFREDIDIPAGATDHPLRDRYTVPVDVTALSIYPHAHYLGKSMKVTATPPGAPPITLLDIPEWDFDWQDEYRFVAPVRLPRGTIVEMDYRFDNSAANVQNPHTPPQRVRFGPQSSDEMATLTLQVLPADAADRPRLDLLRWRRHVARRPRDPGSWRGLGDALVNAGSFAEAVTTFERAIEIEPRLAPAWVGLARARDGEEDRARAITALERALAVDPKSADALNDLAMHRAAAGDAKAAIPMLRRALATNPFHAKALSNLGMQLALAGRHGEADALFRRALAVAPEQAETHNNLANSQFFAGRLDDAATHYRAAIRIRPRYFNALFNLGRVLEAQRQYEECAQVLRRAQAIRPDDPRVRAVLDRLPK